MGERVNEIWITTAAERNLFRNYTFEWSYIFCKCSISKLYTDSLQIYTSSEAIEWKLCVNERKFK